MILLLSLSACSGGDDSQPKVDTSCAFGPTLDVLAPTAGAVLPVGVLTTVEAESESRYADEVTVLWAVTGLDGDAAGLSDSLGAGLTRSWTPEAAGTWRITAQADDACTLDPDHNVSPTQVELEVTVE
jgi:hypothetical protein